MHVHHKETRKTGGNAPNNLVTLCKECHALLHLGKVKLDGKKRGKAMRDAAFMGIMRKTLLERLTAQLNVPVYETKGYITKMQRELNNIAKSHTNDARCIAGYPKAEPCSTSYKSRAVRHHNRQIHKCKISNGGTRKLNQAPYIVKGFRLWDKVSYKGQECFITGRRKTGIMTIKSVDGKMLKDGVSHKKLKFLETANYYITGRM